MLNHAFGESVDKIKGLAILLVVLGHIASPLSSLIYSFHIPLFFFLGGLFIKTTYSDISYLKKNFNRLINPYLIFGLVGLVVNDLKNIALHRPLEDFQQSASGLLWWMDMAHLNHYGFVLWFLPALFWARLIIYFFEKYMKVNSLFLLLMFASSAYVSSGFTNLPLGFDKGLIALPWVFLGFIFNRHKEMLLDLTLWKVLFLITIIFLTWYFGGLQRLDMATKNIGNIFVTIPYTFSVIILIFYLIHNLDFPAIVPLNMVLSKVSQFGSHSLLVLVIHPYINNISHLMVNYFLGDEYWYIKFALSALMLMGLIHIKLIYSESPLFKYL